MANQEHQEQIETTNQAPAWISTHLWHIQPVRDVLLGLGIFALILIAQKASVVTVPLLLAVLLAYLFEPVIGWLMKRFRFSRQAAVSWIIAGIIAFVLIPAFLGASFATGQLISFATNTIDSIELVSEAINDTDALDRTINSALHDGQSDIYGEDIQAIKAVHAGLESQIDLATFAIQNTRARLQVTCDGPWVWVYDQIRISKSQGSVLGDAFFRGIDWVDQNSDQVAQAAAGVLGTVLGMVGAAFGLGFMAFITAFFFFFVATEWVGVQQFGSNLLPDKNRETIMDLLEKFDRVISGFIRGRITIAFIQAVLFSIGFFLIGVPGAFILGPIVAFLSIVPYLALVGIPIAVTLLWFQGHTGFRGEIWWVIGAPTVLYFIGQALDDYVLTPKIQGKSTGMDTPTILFASLAGGALFGIFGMLIAIPIAACVKILIQEIFWPRFKDWAEGRVADPLPIDSDSN